MATAASSSRPTIIVSENESTLRLTAINNLTPVSNVEDEILLEQLVYPEVEVRNQALSRLLVIVGSKSQNFKAALHKLLRKRLSDEKDGHLKIVVILLLERLVQDPFVDQTNTVSDLLSQIDQQLQDDPLLENSYSEDLWCRIFDSACIIIQSSRPSFNFTRPLISKFQSYAISHINHPQWRVRASCLRLLTFTVIWQSRLAGGNGTEEKGKGKGRSTNDNMLSTSELQTILSNFGYDGDSRVRKIALSSLLQLHLNSVKLHVSLYSLCIAALEDEEEGVRRTGLDLIWILSTNYPKHHLLSFKSSSDQLVNDAFVRVCEMANDASVSIREKANRTLSTFFHVDPRFLLQTLDKNQIVQRGGHQSQDSNTGGKRRKNKIKSQIIPTAEGEHDIRGQDEIVASVRGKGNTSGGFWFGSLTACGAFVHALEDEFEEVRRAAVDAICELCIASNEFSQKAIDFLIGMFNDEVDRIRLISIISLRKIAKRSSVVLDAERLQTMLTVLDDAEANVRVCAHGVFRIVNLASQNCLTILLEALETNMKRFPDDYDSICKCLSGLGARHPEFVEGIMDALLRYDRRYLPQEISVDDPTHVGNMILIFNAVSLKPDMMALLPEYALEQFRYLKAKHPACMQDGGKNIFTRPSCNLKARSVIGKRSREVQEGNTESGGRDEQVGDEDIEIFVAHTHGQLTQLNELLERGLLMEAEMIITRCLRDQKYIARAKPAFAGKAGFTVMYLECYKLVIQIKRDYRRPSFPSLAPELASRLMSLSYHMEHTVLGLSGIAKPAIARFRVLAHALWIVGSIGSPPNALLRQFVTRVTQVQRLFEANDATENFDYRDLGDLRVWLLKAINSPSILNLSKINGYLETFIPSPIPVHGATNILKRSIAQITKLTPKSGRANPIEFRADLPLSLQLEAELEYVIDLNDVVIMIRFPDGRTVLRRLDTEDCRCVNVGRNVSRVTARTSVGTLETGWSEPGTLDVRLMLSTPLDLPEMDNELVNYTRREYRFGNGTPNLCDLGDDGAGAMKVYIHPRCSGHGGRGV